MREPVFIQRLLLRSVAMLAVTALLTACWTGAGTTINPKISPQAPGKETTVQELFDHPERYDGQEVVATGMASIEIENTAIRTPKSSIDERGRAVWIEFSELKPEYKKFDRKNVRVRGIFHAGKQGHFGMFDGAITEVKEIKIISK